MKQPTKNNKDKKYKTIVTKKNVKQRKKHPNYGTSKLEEYFAKEFLDKLGVEYVYQFEAKDIGRYYDFFLKNHNLLIEVDGDYW